MKRLSFAQKTVASLLLAALTASSPACGRQKEPAEEPKTAHTPHDALPGADKLAQNIAPDFVVQDLKGSKIASSSLKGKVLLLHFWATWCYYCRKEVAPLNELHRAYGKQGLKILAVSLDRGGAGVVKAMQEKVKMEYPVAMGNNQIQADYGNIRGLPTTFIITPDWTIYRRHMGYVPKSVIEKDIKELLKKQG